MIMRIILGNKGREMPLDEIQTQIKNYANVEIDLGTGDGRYVYKNALKNPETLYIGIDPVEKQLQKYSRSTIRKKVKNVLFVVGSAESLPEELINSANVVNILLPWGSLLNYVANSNPPVLANIKALIKKEGYLRILFGYANQAEPTETDRLNLEKLTTDYLQKIMIPKYAELGFFINETKKLTSLELREYETSWSKKLSFGKDRPIFLLSFQVKK